MPLARPGKSTVWKLVPCDEAEAASIASAHAVHPAMGRVLAARGWKSSESALTHFLSPLLKSLRDPFELLEMDRAVERTLHAIAHEESICIYGDYDVDGVCSTALLMGTLRLLGASPRPVIPHRLHDGYGMSVARVEEIAAEGCTLILTVDNGVSAQEPVRRARELGMDVIITDHHLSTEDPPAAHAYINPNRPDALYEYGRLCGTGVAFKFAHALLKRSTIDETEAKRFLMDQMDLLALGTIADVVPLVGENRIFARHGLEAILNTRRPGLRALLETANYRSRGLSTELVSFGLGPRLNAAGRTDDAMRALELLLTRDCAKAKQLAQYLDFLNRERQKIEREILDASIDEVEINTGTAPYYALVVGGEGWHLGVVGIVAARLTERYDVPAIVLTIEENLARGSARSVPGFDIHEALIACGEYLMTYGGHAAAAGLKLQVSSLPSFRAALNQHAATAFTEGERTTTIEVDSEIIPGEFGWDLYKDLQKMQPFGEGNPAPLFLMRGLRTVGEPRIVGRDHLRLKLDGARRTFDAIGFSLGPLKPLFQNETDILFRPRENTFNGYTSLEMELVDARPSHVA